MIVIKDMEIGKLFWVIWSGPIISRASLVKLFLAELRIKSRCDYICSVKRCEVAVLEDEG